MVEAVIFDLDGVLIDSEKYSSSVELPFLKSVCTDWDNSFHPKGLSRKDVYKICRERGWLKISWTEFFRKYELASQKVYSDLCQLNPNVLTLLNLLRAQRIKIGIATSCPQKTAELVLSRFKIKSYFDVIKTNDDVTLSKPHPEIYLKTVKALKVNPANTIAVEDSISGLTAAKKAGLICLQYGPEKTEIADAKVIDFSEVSIPFLTSLQKNFSFTVENNNF
ncbi:MAG: HAD family phosphatase [Candidatus Diapherotrites archaeon]|nr:HAD family phosphatase [Candidatus Diapherotrites archaeon]